jgi:hypothetical protein
MVMREETRSANAAGAEGRWELLWVFRSRMAMTAASGDTAITR